jgi:hypothetical protein
MYTLEVSQSSHAQDVMVFKDLNALKFKTALNLLAILRKGMTNIWYSWVNNLPNLVHGILALN